MTSIFNITKMYGNITLIVGPMGAGKTTEMISKILRLKFQNGNSQPLRHVVIRKQTDNRFTQSGRNLSGGDEINNFNIEKKTCKIDMKIDTRDSGNQVSNFNNTLCESKVVTHSGIKINAKVANDVRDIEKMIDDYDIFGIEEAHFWPDIIDIVKLLCLHDKHIFITMLNLDYRGMKFSHGPDLYPYAKVIQKTAYCYICGKPTIYTAMVESQKSKMSQRKLLKVQDSRCSNRDVSNITPS